MAENRQRDRAEVIATKRGFPSYERFRDSETYDSVPGDRRVLFNRWAVEEPRHCAEFVLQIRARVTTALEEGGRSLGAIQASCRNRAACRKFLDSGHGGLSRWSSKKR